MARASSKPETAVCAVWHGTGTPHAARRTNCYFRWFGTWHAHTATDAGDSAALGFKPEQIPCGLSRRRVPLRQRTSVAGSWTPRSGQTRQRPGSRLPPSSLNDTCSRGEQFLRAHGERGVARAHGAGTRHGGSQIVTRLVSNWAQHCTRCILGHHHATTHRPRHSQQATCAVRRGARA